jgi:hypothetical protein
MSIRMINSSKRPMPIAMSPKRTTEAGFFRMINGMLPLMAWAGLSLAVIGCGSKDDHHEDHHDDHHHEDHHLEHFVPAHKPADYGALVDQLEKRIAKQSTPTGSGEGTKDQAQSTTGRQELTDRQELMDIIGWIPELAADSELRKKDFEAAVAAGTRLSIALGFAKQTDGSSSVDASTIPKILDELKALVSKSQTSTEPM